jgi:hypothetical protein
LLGLASSTFFIAMGGDRTLMSAPWWLLLSTAFSPLFVFIEPDIPEQDSGSLLLGTLGSLSLLLGFSFYFNVPLGGPWTATGLLFGVSLFLVMLKQRRG